MIRLGLDYAAKAEAVSAYCAEHQIRKAFVLSPERFRCEFPLESPVEYIEYDQIIQYKFFYRLLQEIDRNVLVVVNECMRTQTRQDLTYNCIRHFLSQTQHQLVFQYLPIVDTFEDFMILLDFDTRTKWKRAVFTADMLEGIDLEGSVRTPSVASIPVATDAKTKAAYLVEKQKLIDNIGLKDPHTIPRNLHLLSGKAKLSCVCPDTSYVGRNNRFKLDHLETYREVSGESPRIAFEFCHNFLDFSDFLAVTRQTEIQALVSDLKVDQWYLERYRDWSARVANAYETLGLTFRSGAEAQRA